jgi:GNAT superfamily N-acetyltransferase
MEISQILVIYDQDRKTVRLFDTKREETAHLVRHIFPDGEGMIIYSRLASSNVEDVIREQIAHFENVGRDFSWIVYQHDTPKNLKDRLLAHGFQADDPDVTMVLDVQDASPALLEPVNYDIRRIDDPNKIEDVLAIRHQVWKGDYSSAAQSLAKRLTEAPESLALYVAYVDGKPVSTAQVSFYQQGKFAGLVQAATLPDYRGRGFYTNLVAFRVQEAKRRGIRFLDADASPMSRPILEKLGFKQLTKAYSCTWRFKGI